MKTIDKLVGLLWLPLLAIVYWRIPQVPVDFALKISGMFYDEIDTFSGKYARGGVSRPNKTTIVDGKLMKEIVVADSIVSFSFTRDEQQEIYLFLQQMNYTYYPTDISAKCKSQIVPSHKVELTVRANKKLKRISYQDGCMDETMQHKEFGKLINLLYDIAHRHEEVRRLPETMLLDM